MCKVRSYWICGVLLEHIVVIQSFHEQDIEPKSPDQCPARQLHHHCCVNEKQMLKYFVL